MSQPGRSLGFVIAETTRQEGKPEDTVLCWVLAGGRNGILPDEQGARREAERMAAHAALDADLNEGVTFTYSVAEVVVSR